MLLSLIIPKMDRFLSNRKKRNENATAAAAERYWEKRKATTSSRTSPQDHFTKRKMNIRPLYEGYMVALWK